jgi:hypothetical protein
MQRRRQLVFFYLRPTLYDALAERAKRRGGDLNSEILGVLERELLPRRRRGRASYLRPLTNEAPALPGKDQAGARGPGGRVGLES